MSKVHDMCIDVTQVMKGRHLEVRIKLTGKWRVKLALVLFKLGSWVLGADAPTVRPCDTSPATPSPSQEHPSRT